MATATRAAESDAPVEETPEVASEPGGPEEDAPRDDERPRGLFAKLAKIMGELSAIPSDKMRHVTVETRSGGSYSYDYITEATLMEELRPRLAREGIATLYSDRILRSPDTSEDSDNLTVVQVTLTFVDGETGEKWNSHAEGYGTDLGDKGANKAKTSALRYLLWKTFLFASDLDPETESVERRSSGGGRSRGSGGRPASAKQKEFARKILTEADEAGLRDTDGRRPQDAVHVRTAVEDLSGPNASWLIDETMAAKKAIGTADLDQIVAKWTSGLDEKLGPPRETGDVGGEPAETTEPEEPTGAGPSDGGYA